MPEIPYLLSVVIWLPIVGMLAVLALDGKAARMTALITTLVTFVVSLGLWAQFDPLLLDGQMTETFAWFGDTIDIKYAIGVDGLNLLLLLLTTFLGPIVILGSWTYIGKHHKGYYALLLLLQTGVTGVFAVLRRDSVLRLLRADADPDVLHHRHLGRREPHLRVDQVRHLHARRFAADAGRNLLDGPGGGRRDQRRRLHERLLQVGPLRPAAGIADVAVLPLRPRILYQSAALPTAHVAARRSRASADGRVGRAGGRAAQNGYVRPDALLPAVLPGRRAEVRLPVRDPRRDRHHLRRDDLARADRRQEAGRLLVGARTWASSSWVCSRSRPRRFRAR